ncbi:MAG: type II toxin-antitoxin system prevent-host-death family antitoxin [Rhodobacteraceae bacterium]|nr:type II toxin-antitoxin system prevent-host-death family antitoxin [Paracoccaceae bacterium]
MEIKNHVGAFEAKTHFSALLQEASRGKKIVITLRGKPVAKIVPFEEPESPNTNDLLTRINNLRNRISLQTGPISLDEILSFRDEGRK